MHRDTSLAVERAATSAWRPRFQSGLRMEVIEGEAVVLDRDHDRVHYLNEVATFILGRCSGDATEAEIVEAVLDAYDVDEAMGALDVSQLLRQMRDLDILDP